MKGKPIKFYRSSIEGRIPDPAMMQEGEIALNLFAGKEKIFIRNSNGQIASFISEPEIAKSLDALLQLVNAKMDKARYDGFNVVKNLSNLPIDKRLIFANIKASSAFSLSGIPASGMEVHVIIKNTGSADITIPIPNTGNYLSTGVDNMTLKPGKYGEINVVSDGTKMFVRGL